MLGAGVQAAGAPRGPGLRAAARARARLLAPPRARRRARRDDGRALRPCDASAAGSVEDALRGADVVVTATTAREPIVERDWLAPGAHVNAVGSSIPTTRELDGATHGRARASFVDAASRALNESGDFLLAMREGAIAEDIALAELGEVLAGSAPGPHDADELTVFVSLGLAVEDLAAAELALRVAEQRGIGAEVTL